MQYKIITISRELGSGGRIIGKKVADQLGYHFYDREIIDQTAKISGFSKEQILHSEEKITNSFLYNVAMGTGYGLGVLSGNGKESLPLNAQIYLAQRQAIQTLAKKGPCVIVGRCADYILKDEPGVLSCFVYAELQKRVNRAVNEYGMDAENAEKQILQTDKSRAVYYNAVTDQKWGDYSNYDLMINSEKVGINMAAKLIAFLAIGSNQDT